MLIVNLATYNKYIYSLTPSAQLCTHRIECCIQNLHFIPYEVEWIFSCKYYNALRF